MKISKMIIAAFAAVALVATSCEKYDDSEIKKDITDIKTEISDIKTDISTLKEAVQNKYAVESVEAVENGYTIKFTNGKSVTIYNGQDGDKGEQGDAFFKSVEQDAETVTITLVDDSVYVLAKVVKIGLGDPDLNFILIDDQNDTVEITIPEISDIASVAATVFGKDGSTTDVVTKSPVSGWTVTLAPDYSSAKIEADGVAKGSKALFQVSVVKKDGTTYTASKAIIYYMTDDAAFEEFFLSFEQLQEEWTMVLHSTVNNEEYEDEKYDAIKEEVFNILSGISQNIQTKMTWAEESYNNGTLAGDLDEILASFEEIQIHLTQALNLFNDTVAAIDANDAAFEAFSAEYQSLQEQYTMVYNSTVGSVEELTAEQEEILLPVLSGIEQMISTKMTWAEESYANGTLAADLDEILSTFEEVQIALTQFMNLFTDTLGNDAAFEAFSAEYQSLQQQYTMVYNSTVGSVELTAEQEEILLPVLSGIEQMISSKMTWAEESYANGTLAADLDEILSTFEEVQTALTQFMNLFTDTLANDAAFEAFSTEYQSLQQQYTMVYNSTVGSVELTAEQEELFLPILSGIEQMISGKMAWAEESYNNGTLAADLDEILSTFEEVQTALTQFLNLFNDTLAEAQAFEEFAAMYESIGQQWTMVYQSTVAGATLTEAQENLLLPVLSGISQNIESLMTWADESYNNGTLAADLDEILGSFEQIQIELTQFINLFNDTIAADNDKAFEEFYAMYESMGQQWTMVYNSTVGSVDLTEEQEEILLPMINGISQNIQTKMTWAEESYNAGTLAAELDEILAAFEDDQKMLHQFINYFNNVLFGEE